MRKPLPLTADIYPKYPRITQELKDQGIISVCGDRPCDQVRANLRKFDASNVVSGLNGTLTGTHTIVNNALATKQPFGQAALGAWHFAKNDPVALEARTNEQDHFAEPAEHLVDAFGAGHERYSPALTRSVWPVTIRARSDSR